MTIPTAARAVAAALLPILALAGCETTERNPPTPQRTDPPPPALFIPTREDCLNALELDLTGVIRDGDEPTITGADRGPSCEPLNLTPQEWTEIVVEAMRNIKRNGVHVGGME